jgi:hypothetical protein
MCYQIMIKWFEISYNKTIDLITKMQHEAENYRRGGGAQVHLHGIPNVHVLNHSKTNSERRITGEEVTPKCIFVASHTLPVLKYLRSFYTQLLRCAGRFRALCRRIGCTA